MTVTATEREDLVQVDWVRKSVYQDLKEEHDKKLALIENLKNKLYQAESKVGSFQGLLTEQVIDSTIHIDTAQSYADIFGFELKKEINGVATATFEFTVLAPLNYEMSDLDFTVDSLLESTDNDVEVIDSSLENVEVDYS
jgi:hypothetical protein